MLIGRRTAKKVSAQFVNKTCMGSFVNDEHLFQIGTI